MGNQKQSLTPLRHPGSPATSPSLYLPSGQTHLLGRLVVFHVGLLVKQQCQPKALHDLDRHGSAADCVQGHLHEIVRESTRSGAWSWHSGVLSVPGFFWEFISFYKKSAVTATLFVKRTTKCVAVALRCGKLLDSLRSIPACPGLGIARACVEDHFPEPERFRRITALFGQNG